LKVTQIARNVIGPGLVRRCGVVDSKITLSLLAD